MTVKLLLPPASGALKNKFSKGETTENLSERIPHSLPLTVELLIPFSLPSLHQVYRLEALKGMYTHIPIHGREMHNIKLQ